MPNDAHNFNAAARMVQPKRPACKHRRGFDRALLPSPLDYYTRELGRLLGAGEWRMARCKLPGHDDRRASLSVLVCDSPFPPYLTGGGFKCFGCGRKGGGIVDFHCLRYGMDFKTAARALGAWRD